MKATLIDFKKKVIDVQSRDPYLKVKVLSPDGVITKDFASIDPKDINFFGGEDKAYELIELHSIDKSNRKMTQRYFVNQDDVKITFPIIEAMVRVRTKVLQEERDLAMDTYQKVHKKYLRLRSYWFNRVLEWLFEKTDPKE